MPNTTASSRLSNLAVLLITLLCCAAAAEIALRIFTPYPVGYSTNKAPDRDLGYRLSSEFPEADTAGFRNSASAKTEILALGDSHTYGNNVGPQDSWPAVLSRESGLATYNAGVGSYGILAYHAMLTSGCLPQARAAIVALYPANDFALGGSNCLIIDDPSPFWQAEAAALGLVWPELKKSCDELEGISLNDWLEVNSAIVGSVRAAVRGRQGLPPDKPRYDFTDSVQPLLAKRVKKHSRNTDFASHGMAAMFANFERLAAAWGKLEAFTVGVMIVPSRERVVYGYFDTRNRLGELPSAFVQHMQNQIILEKRCIQVLSDAGIPYREALPEVLDAFAAELQAGRAFYPAQDDGHPLEAGYASYAACARALLADMGVTAP